MCGICGFAGLKNDGLLKAMNASLVHRGPDEDGFFSEEDRVSLGMRRLKIIDLATGSQPIFNEDRSVAVVFNGEIYNFRELRKDLEAKGHKFRTNTDTEVLAHLYEEHYEDFPKLLRGMFAFALWDAKERKLLLGRDQFGIKPLYYAVSGDKLYFASELKALRLVSGLCAALDPKALDYYFTYLYIPAPLTAYSGVRKLEPASLLRFRNGTAAVERYWELEPEQNSGKPEEFYVERIRDLLSESVREQLVSDVPLGLLLSGGMDSVSLLSFMARHAGSGVRTFTASFGGGGGFDESALAAAAAGHFGAEHKAVRVEADIGALIRKLAGHFDEPFADSSALATYLVTKAARSGVTVALAGIGGDELFGGYPRHLGARLLPAWLKAPRAFRRLAGGAASLLPESRSSFNLPGRFKRFLRSGAGGFGEAYNSWISYLGPEEKRSFYSGALLAEAASGGASLPGLPEGPDDIFGFELGSYLPDDLLCLADRASMANSLELRVPFLDTRLVEFMAGIPLAERTRGFRLKYLLRRAMSDRLPAEILNAPKHGFQVPLAEWQEKGLKSFTAEALSPDRVRQAGVLSPEGVRRMLAEHASGRRNLYDRIYAASVFHLWLEDSRHNPPATISAPWSVEGKRKVLFVNLAGMGDMVMMTPAVRALKASYPGAVLETLCLERGRSVAEGVPGIDKVHSVPMWGATPGPLDLLRLVLKLLDLRKEGYDALVNFSLVSSFGGLLKVRLINLLVAPGFSVCRILRGLGSAGDHALFEEKAAEASEVEMTGRLLLPLGVELRDTGIKFVPSEKDMAKVSGDLARRGLSGRPVIGLNPGGFRPSRRWPAEKWKELAGLLKKRYPGALILVTGSAAEAGLVNGIAGAGGAHAVVGYTVPESAALYSLMDVFITNNTGPMHLAAAVGARTVCIFGPGDHVRFAPSVPEKRRRILSKGAPDCETPCDKPECDTMACFAAIPAHDVLAAAEELLG